MSPKTFDSHLNNPSVLYHAGTFQWKVLTHWLFCFSQFSHWKAVVTLKQNIKHLDMGRKSKSVVEKWNFQFLAHLPLILITSSCILSILLASFMIVAWNFFPNSFRWFPHVVSIVQFNLTVSVWVKLDNYGSQIIWCSTVTDISLIACTWLSVFCHVKIVFFKCTLRWWFVEKSNSELLLIWVGSI